jgi:ADP-ribose pyrophosphatase
MNEIFSRIDSNLIHSNPYWDYRLDEYILPSGSTGKYYYVDSRGSTIIIPKLSEDTFILTSQFRYLNKKESIEFPGGGLTTNLTFEENALKELEEETGYKSNKLTLLGEFNPFNGVTDEICKVFLAEELEKSIANPDESESIKILEFNSDEINNMISSNKIWDGMSISAYLMYVLINKKL